MKAKFDLLDILLVMAKRKRLIIGITMGAAFLVAVISLLMSPIYRAETKILSPQVNSSMTAQILNQIGAACRVPRRCARGQVTQ